MEHGSSLGFTTIHRRGTLQGQSSHMRDHHHQRLDSDLTPLLHQCNAIDFNGITPLICSEVTEVRQNQALIKGPALYHLLLSAVLICAVLTALFTTVNCTHLLNSKCLQDRALGLLCFLTSSGR